VKTSLYGFFHFTPKLTLQDSSLYAPSSRSVQATLHPPPTRRPRPSSHGKTDARQGVPRRSPQHVPEMFPGSGRSPRNFLPGTFFRTKLSCQKKFHGEKIFTLRCSRNSLYAVPETHFTLFQKLTLRLFGISLYASRVKFLFGRVRLDFQMIFK